MILARRQPFAVSGHHGERFPERAALDREKGPLLRVQVRFQQWLEGREVEADAFIDPGADLTVVSVRWAALLADRHGPTTDLLMDGGFILEDVLVTIGSQALLVPKTEAGPQLWSQPGDMGGYEDILLGRDFLTAHGLLLVIDGDRSDFSLLFPGDEENRRLRDQVRAAF